MDLDGWEFIGVYVDEHWKLCIDYWKLKKKNEQYSIFNAQYSCLHIPIEPISTWKETKFK